MRTSAKQAAIRLKALGFEALSVSEPNDEEDGEIKISDMVHVQVGYDYINVVKQHGEGDAPGTRVALRLAFEGRPWSLEPPVEACLVVARDRAGFTYHLKLDLAALSDADRQLVSLFIFKGRGAPELLPPEGR